MSDCVTNIIFTIDPTTNVECPALAGENDLGSPRFMGSFQYGFPRCSSCVLGFVSMPGSRLYARLNVERGLWNSSKQFLTQSRERKLPQTKIAEIRLVGFGSQSNLNRTNGALVETMLLHWWLAVGWMLPLNVSYAEYDDGEVHVGFFPTLHRC